MISYLIPTRDRPEELARTLGSIAALGDHAETGGAEVIVVDNASRERPVVLARAGDVPVRLVTLRENLGAAARNVGARRADGRSAWLVMLDDDSAPVDGAFLSRLSSVPAGVGAVSADIALPDGSRERGGLPEVFVGCGAAVRAGVFRDLGGYDGSFGYYAEEYDFSARLIASGFSVRFEPAFRVLHRKAAHGRDFGVILSRLVRNNGWVIARYAPDDELDGAMGAMLERYGAVAQREGVTGAYESARRELRATLGAQPRMALDAAGWARFTGLSAAREALRALGPAGAGRVSLVEPGKHAEVVRRAVEERGLSVADGAGVRVIATLSPGPMLDAMARLGSDARVIAPWMEAERFRPVGRAAAA
jgi:GT2 family glycosyltransferase